MLERLEGENFQAHETISLDLDPSITTITGPSDRGKSSLVRLLLWITLNKPSGKAYLRRGAKAMRGVLHFDGKELVRERGDENAYYLDGEKYVAFGSSVPRDIVATISLDAINFATQTDNLFWFNLSPGELSRSLNAVVRLDLIDRTLSTIATKLKRTTTERDISKKRLQSAKENVRNLEWVVEAGEELDRLDKLDKDVRKRRQEASEMRFLVEEGERLNKGIQDAAGAILDAANLVRLTRTYRETEARMGFLRRLIGNAQEVETSGPVHYDSKGIRSLALVATTVERTREVIGFLGRLIERATDKEKQACSARIERRRLTKELETRNERCPLCGKRRTPSSSS